MEGLLREGISGEYFVAVAAAMLELATRSGHYGSDQQRSGIVDNSRSSIPLKQNMSLAMTNRVGRMRVEAMRAIRGRLSDVNAQMIALGICPGRKTQSSTKLSVQQVVQSDALLTRYTLSLLQLQDSAGLHAVQAAVLGLPVPMSSSARIFTL